MHSLRFQSERNIMRRKVIALKCAAGMGYGVKRFKQKAQRGEEPTFSEESFLHS